MPNFTLTFIFAFIFSTALFADVDAVRITTSSGKQINVLKGLAAVPKVSNTTLPKLEIGQFAKGKDSKVTLMTCETRGGQKFSEGDFGYSECLNEKKDQAKMNSVAPPIPGAPGKGPGLEDLRLNLDHTFSF